MNFLVPVSLRNRETCRLYSGYEQKSDAIERTGLQNKMIKQVN